MPDLRTWLDEVDKLGQLMTVENAHWDLELSTLPSPVDIAVAVRSLQAT